MGRSPLLHNDRLAWFGSFQPRTLLEALATESNRAPHLARAPRPTSERGVGRRVTSPTTSGKPAESKDLHRNLATSLRPQVKGAVSERMTP